MPPFRCKFPYRNPGSTWVVSMAMVKIRSPFLAIERGSVARTTVVFRQKDRRNKCASTMLVTTSTKLERRLLHSWATSSLNPGIDSMIPSCVTGTPKAENSKLAESAEPCCQRATTLFNASVGTGTNQNKKQRGKSNARKTPTPKQTINAPSHQVTSPSMLKQRRTSVSAVNLTLTPISTATAIKAEPK